MYYISHFFPYRHAHRIILPPQQRRYMLMDRREMLPLWSSAFIMPWQQKFVDRTALAKIKRYVNTWRHRRHLGEPQGNPKAIRCSTLYTHLCECWRVLKFGMNDVRHVILLCLITPFSRLIKIQTGMAVSVRQGTYFGLADLQLLQIQAVLQRLVTLTAFSSCVDICLDKINKQIPERMSTYKSGVQCCSIIFPKFNHATIINASIDVSNAYIILYHIHHNHHMHYFFQQFAPPHDQVSGTGNFSRIICGSCHQLEPDSHCLSNELQECLFFAEFLPLWHSAAKKCLEQPPKKRKKNSQHLATTFPSSELASLFPETWGKGLVFGRWGHSLAVCTRKRTKMSITSTLLNTLYVYIIQYIEI